MNISVKTKVLLAGFCSQLLCIGIARFAYTPLLPLMQEQMGLSDTAGGWLATVNYIGYMLGAVIASVVVDFERKDRLYRLALFVAVVGGVILWRFLPKSSMAQRLVMAETSADPSTVISGGGSSFSGQTELPEIGATGVVLSDLHPSGMVEIRGHRFEAKVDVGTLSKGEAIIVIGYRNFYLAVAKNIES